MNEPTTQNDEYVYIFFYAAPKHTDVCFVWNCHVGPFQVKISAMSTKQEFSIAALYLSKRFFYEWCSLIVIFVYLYPMANNMQYCMILASNRI